MTYFLIALAAALAVVAIKLWFNVKDLKMALEKQENDSEITQQYLESELKVAEIYYQKLQKANEGLQKSCMDAENLQQEQTASLNAALATINNHEKLISRKNGKIADLQLELDTISESHQMQRDELALAQRSLTFEQNKVAELSKQLQEIKQAPEYVEGEEIIIDDNTLPARPNNPELPNLGGTGA